MKITKHLDWKNPSIEIEDGSFEIEITNKNIDIMCSWDYGWAGRGSERVSIPLQLLRGLIDQYTEREE
jgi:hypothetical protein